MEKHEINLDNFIKERIEGLYPQKFDVEPTPDFARDTIKKIYRLERRRYLFLQYGFATLLALTPLVFKYFWLLIRNDYFSLTRLPFGNLIVLVYHFVISFAGNFLLFVFGVLFSVLFVLKFRHGELGFSAKSAKIA